MLSSNVVGLDIYNSQNDDIGKVQDIAFDEEGDRNATKDQLKSAPEFKYGGQWTASRS
jgi:hypothetical protein